MPYMRQSAFVLFALGVLGASLTWTSGVGAAPTITM